MFVMDDLEDILMEDIDDLLEPAEGSCREPAEAKPAAEKTAAGLRSAGKASMEMKSLSGEETSSPEKEVSPADGTVVETETPAETGQPADGRKPAEIKAPADGRRPAERTPEFGKIPDYPEDEKKGKNAKRKKESEEFMLKGMSEPKPKKKKFPWKPVLIVLVSLAVLSAAGVYGYGVNYYTYHFLPGTVAEGVRVDGLTVQQAQRLLMNEKITDDLTIELTTKDGKTVELDTTPMQIRREYLGIQEALEAQDKWRFFLNRETEKPVSLDYRIGFDRAGAKTALEALEICDPEKTQSPADSYVYQDGETGEWKVREAVDGDTLDTDILAKAVADTVERGESHLDIAGTGAYLTAQVREDDPELCRRASLENAVDSQRFIIALGADTVRAITAAEFRSVLKDGIFDEDHPETVLDEEKYTRLMNSIARSYTTKSASGYKYFKSITGKRIAMKTDYGWEMDEQATSVMVRQMLEEAGTRIFTDPAAEETYPHHIVEAVWSQTAISHGERDFGLNWVEVNLTRQKVYCVINGEIALESDVVSGTEKNSGRRTPAGYFKIRMKTTERDLVGYNSDGTEAYRSHVHYWMPVYNNIGLHDATWRYAFGGNHFLYDGSHGCVNMPLKAAAKLYSLVYKDMPVIFYRENLNG